MTRLTTQLTRYAPGLHMEPHHDGCRRLSVVVSGGMLESDRARIEASRAGSVALKAPEFEHADHFGDQGALILSVVLPDAQVWKLGLDPGRLAHWRWFHAGRPSLSALRLAAGLLCRNSDLAGAGLSSLLSAFARGDAPHTVPKRVRRVCAALGDQRAEPGAYPSGEATRTRVTVEALAEHEGVHSVSLGRLFRRHMGCSITRYRQDLRLSSVAHSLIVHDLELVDLALDHGFSDLSHMTRLFTAGLGIPPGRFRSVMRGLSQGLDSFKTEWSFSV